MDDNLIQWDNEFIKIMQYSDKHNKLPSITDNDPDAMDMGDWITKQLMDRVNKTGCMANPIIVDRWMAFMKEPRHIEYFHDDDEAWHIIFDQFKTYLNTHEKRPSLNDPDPNVRFLARWGNIQQKDYDIVTKQKNRKKKK